MSASTQAWFGFSTGVLIAYMFVSFLVWLRTDKPQKRTSILLHSEENALPWSEPITVDEWDRQMAELFNNNYPGYPFQDSNENLKIPGITDGSQPFSNDAHLVPAIDIKGRITYIRRELF